MKGKIFLIAGPSGVGKGTIISKIKNEFPGIIFPVSSTTRAKRPDEVEGRVYNYLTREEFEQGIKQDKFFEYAVVHGKDYYGTPKKPILEALNRGEVLLREVDMQGVKSFEKTLDKTNYVSIFLKPDNLEVLLSRIERRGKLPEEEMTRRMASARQEMELGSICDYQVFSLEGKVEEAYDEVKGIILNEVEKSGLII